MDVDYINSDDKEEWVIVCDDPNGLEVESGDDMTGNDAWVWKSSSP